MLQTIYHIYNNNTFTIGDLLKTLDIQIKVVEPAELANKLRTSSRPARCPSIERLKQWRIYRNAYNVRTNKRLAKFYRF